MTKTGKIIAGIMLLVPVTSAADEPTKCVEMATPEMKVRFCGLKHSRMDSLSFEEQVRRALDPGPFDMGPLLERAAETERSREASAWVHVGLVAAKVFREQAEAEVTEVRPSVALSSFVPAVSPAADRGRWQHCGMLLMCPPPPCPWCPPPLPFPFPTPYLPFDESLWLLGPGLFEHN